MVLKFGGIPENEIDRAIKEVFAESDIKDPGWRDRALMEIGREDLIKHPTSL